MQTRCTATTTTFTNVLKPSNPGPTLWVINRAGAVEVERGGWAGGGPGSVHFLQRPEGELQSSPSWPFHHPSDTDRLHHPHSLTSPHQHSSSPLLASPKSPSFLTWSYSALFLLRLVLCFLFCCTPSILPCILQVLIKSVTFDSSVMSELCFPLFNLFFTLPFFPLGLVISPPVTWRYSGGLNPQRSLTLLRLDIRHIFPAVTPSSDISYFPFTFPSIPPPSPLNPSLILELINPAQGHDEATRTLSQYWFLFSPSLSLYISLSSCLLCFHLLPS